MPLDFTHYPFSEDEIPDPMRDDPCWPPPLQLIDDELSPDFFDQEYDNIDEEVNEVDLPPDKIDALFSSTRNTNPDISTKISTLSEFTNSTNSSYEFALSQYSFNFTSSESDYSNPLGFETRGALPVNSWPQAFIPLADDPLPYIPSLNPAEAMGLNPNFLAEDCSALMQHLEPLTCVDPALTIHVMSDSEAPMAPVDLNEPFKCPYCPFSSALEYNLETHIRTHDTETYPNFLADDQSIAVQQLESVTHVEQLPAQSVHMTSSSEARKVPVKKFKCPHRDCSFSSARKYNLTTHIGTHDKEASKRFRCGTCDRPFSRKNDRDRHRLNIHFPQYRTTAVSEDGRLMPSLDSGSSSNAGVEDLSARWEYAAWLQGVV